MRLKKGKIKIGLVYAVCGYCGKLFKKDRRRKYCSEECFRKKRYESNKAHGAAYYRKNIECQRARARAYYQRNRERLNAKKKAWYWSHKWEIKR